MDTCSLRGMGDSSWLLACRPPLGSNARTLDPPRSTVTLSGDTAPASPFPWESTGAEDRWGSLPPQYSFWRAATLLPDESQYRTRKSEDQRSYYLITQRSVFRHRLAMQSQGPLGFTNKADSTTVDKSRKTPTSTMSWRPS